MKINPQIRSKSTSPRYIEIDFFRGMAILMMIIFHTSFDLNLFKITQLPIFTNPFWLVYRESGVFMFLSISGFCLYLEHRSKIRWKRFWIRFGKLILAGSLITFATHYYDPPRTIWLGILQFFALASLFGLFFLRYYRLNLILGVLIIALGFIGNANEAQNFMGFAFTWLGFGTMHLHTLEIFPMIPFFGYFLVGMFMGRYFLEDENREYLIVNLSPQNSSVKFVSFFGKYSLIIYLIHQPIILGIISLLTHKSLLG